ncbi:ubiquitin-conjugating enzyme E2 U [Pleurodeles waltl]|uniref:ubiquitin-conjugating enzyme E2 U n=1 Tax=Pleurodeles waltl TaxID=8319 RepID=UPI00370967F7
MHSRTYLLLEREYTQLQESNIYGISATPVNDNFLEWIAKVQGLKDSIWEDAILQLSMKYTERYNEIPPTITFNTIPFHPNVSVSSGKPCVSFLDNPEEWNTRNTMSSILLTIQTMLSNPVLENAVNMEAATMLKDNPSQYRKIVSECVRTSRELEAGIIKEPGYVNRILIPDSASQTHERKIKNISFEDYHKAWSEIATSQTVEDLKNPLLKDPVLQMDNYDLKKNKNNEPDPRELQDYTIVVHGVSTKPQRTKVQDCEKQSRVSKITMRETYPPHKASDKPLPLSIATQMESTKRHKEEQWEKEVDNLVDWTNTLSTDTLED